MVDHGRLLICELNWGLFLAGIQSLAAMAPWVVAQKKGAQAPLEVDPKLQDGADSRNLDPEKFAKGKGQGPVMLPCCMGFHGHAQYFAMFSHVFR